MSRLIQERPFTVTSVELVDLLSSGNCFSQDSRSAQAMMALLGLWNNEERERGVPLQSFQGWVGNVET